MNISESIINNLLIEFDSLTSRLKNIKHSFKTTSNVRLRERLIKENKSIFERINEIHKIAWLIKKRSKEEISFSSLLIEKTNRLFNETKTESNLFLL